MVLFVTMDAPVGALRKGVTRVRSQRERMSLMFRHDQQTRLAA
jgi:hypothetical protein